MVVKVIKIYCTEGGDKKKGKNKTKFQHHLMKKHYFLIITF